MKIISTRIHGVLDYLMGTLFILMPVWFNWNEPEMGLMTTLGWLTIGVSLFTAYELSLFNVVPMTAHLWLDTIVAVALIVAPFSILGVDPVARNWMVGLGLLEMGAVMMTQSRPSNRATRNLLDRPV